MTHRSPAERMRDRAFIEEQHCRRVPIREIANRLTQAHYPNAPISKSTIGSDIKEIEAEWIEREQQSIQTRKAQDLASLDKIECEAWDEWTRSKLDMRRQEMSEEDGVTGAGTKRRKVAKVEGRIGDGSFLSIILKCGERRADLCGYKSVPSVRIFEGNSVGMEAMVALAQNPAGYADVEPLLPPECFNGGESETTEAD